jgi:hypothetical protein
MGDIQPLVRAFLSLYSAIASPEFRANAEEYYDRELEDAFFYLSQLDVDMLAAVRDAFIAERADEANRPFGFERGVAVG